MTNDDEYDGDDEQVWDEICRMCAKKTGVPFERAKAILESRGYHAYGHAGIVDALETVQHVVTEDTKKRL
jgi:hypothetical protein